MSTQPPAKPRPGFPARMPATSVASPQRSPVLVAKPQIATTQKSLVKPQAALAGLRSVPPVQGTGLDSAAVRTRMVQKLQASGLTDPRVLNALATVERHRFVDSALVNQAYEDTSLPIGLGQTISKPNVVGRMMELLLAKSTGRMGRVLEIGSGCGYQAALLSHVATEVYSIERLRGLYEKAQSNIAHMKARNIQLILGDGMLGFAKGAPYAGIIAAAGGEALPQAWLDQLAVGGRLVAPVAAGKGAQALVVVDRTPKGFEQNWLEAVQFVPLKSGLA